MCIGEELADLLLCGSTNNETAVSTLENVAQTQAGGEKSQLEEVQHVSF